MKPKTIFIFTLALFVLCVKEATCHLPAVSCVAYPYYGSQFIITLFFRNQLINNKDKGRIDCRQHSKLRTQSLTITQSKKDYYEITYVVTFVTTSSTPVAEQNLALGSKITNLTIITKAIKNREINL